MNKRHLKKRIKEEMSWLRKIIRKAFRITNRVSPLPWDGLRKAWIATIEIGYAIKDEDRLKFNKYSELTDEERIDAG
jgi:hypothetical protein